MTTKKTEMHDFTRASGYVSWGYRRFDNHTQALNQAFEEGYNEVLIMNDAQVNLVKWYYTADATGYWTCADPSSSKYEVMQDIARLFDNKVTKLVNDYFNETIQPMLDAIEPTLPKPLEVDFGFGVMEFRISQNWQRLEIHGTFKVDPKNTESGYNQVFTINGVDYKGLTVEITGEDFCYGKFVRVPDYSKPYKSGSDYPSDAAREKIKTMMKPFVGHIWKYFEPHYVNYHKARALYSLKPRVTVDYRDAQCYDQMRKRSL